MNLADSFVTVVGDLSDMTWCCSIDDVGSTVIIWSQIEHWVLQIVLRMLPPSLA